MSAWDSVGFLLPTAIILPLLGAGLALVFRGSMLASRIISVGFLLLKLVAESVMLVAIDHTGPIVAHIGGWWAPVGIALVADRFAAILMVTSTVVTLGVLWYAISQHRSDEKPDGSSAAFHPAMLIMAAGVANAFAAGDLFNLFVSFEILLTASYVLLTLGGTAQRMRAGAPYVVVSLLSSVIFLCGIALTYAAAGTVNLADLALRLHHVSPGAAAVLHALLLVAFGIKAAIWPMSVWLPDSYPSAPAPVTAVFAGLLTKVGIYAIIRVHTVVFAGQGFNSVLLWASLATMLIGILGAVAQKDIKRMLSFTLVSHMGYLLFGLALGTHMALAATIYYVVHHILVQTALFLGAGLIEYLRGTTDIGRLGGLARSAPLMAILFFIPAMNLGGIPPLSGFLGKVGLFTAGLTDHGWLAAVVVGGGTLTSLITLYAMVRVWGRAFWRPTPLHDAASSETLAMDVNEDVALPAPAEVTLASGDSSHTPAGVPTVVPPVTSRIRIRPAKLPRGMLAATTAIVAAGVMLTVAAGPIYQFADRAAGDIAHPTPYISAVMEVP